MASRARYPTGYPVAAGRAWRAFSHANRVRSDRMADSFHPDLYVTCATVIPVLLVAAALQGRTYETDLGARKVGPTRRALLRLLGSKMALQLGYLMVMAGGLGEFVALYALLLRTDTHLLRWLVFVATGLLQVVVLVGPFQGYLRSARVFPLMRATFGAGEVAEDQREEPPPGTPGTGDESGGS
jgi:hypothetical protein